MRNKHAVPVIILLFCALSTLYFVQLDTSTHDTPNRNSSNSDKFLLPTLEPGLSPRNPEVEADVVDVNLEPCNCSRRLTRLTPVETISLSETTCSEASFARGGNQKVVSFSYYEKNKKWSQKRLKTGKIKDNVFLRGLGINLDLLPRLYPGRRQYNKLSTKNFPDFISKFSPMNAMLPNVSESLLKIFYSF